MTSAAAAKDFLVVHKGHDIESLWRVTGLAVIAAGDMGGRLGQELRIATGMAVTTVIGKTTVEMVSRGRRQGSIVEGDYQGHCTRARRAIGTDCQLNCVGTGLIRLEGRVDRVGAR